MGVFCAVGQTTVECIQPLQLNDETYILPTNLPTELFDGNGSDKPLQFTC